MKILAVLVYLIGVGLALGLGTYILLFDKLSDQPPSRGFILVILLIALIFMVIALMIKRRNETNKNKIKRF